MSNMTREDMRQLKSKILMNSLRSGHNLYLGINGTSTWPDEVDPPQPKDTAKTISDFWDHLIGFKRIKAEETRSVIAHVKWLPGRTFEKRRLDEDTSFQMRHYCVNKNFEVYECVGVTMNDTEYPRTVNEPMGHNAGNTISTDDGYQWKFLYELTVNDIEKRVSHDFIPVYVRDADFTDNQKKYGSKNVEHILNVRHISCRIPLKKETHWGTVTHYRQYGLFIDIRNKSDLKIATADLLAPADVLDESGYLIYTENVRKRPFEDNRTDVIEIVIEC